MEDHHHNHQYGIADLRQLINITGRPPPPHFTSLQPPPDLFSRQQNYDHMMLIGMPRGPTTTTTTTTGNLQDFISHDTSNQITPTSTAAAAAGATTSMSVSGGGESGCFMGGGGDMGGNGRWPRQETLTLLEIRSRLDSKFKEATQKGPLWDEVSRIMAEEHGYQRSGKKCREKFENLHKYYKKTKEGKASRQDGKHYRFFRQLEALYGDNTIITAHPLIQETTIQFNNTSNTSSSGFDISSSERSTEPNDSVEKKTKKKRGVRSWKLKIKEFIDSQMRKLIEKQEEWLDKLTKTLDQREHERFLKDQQWRQQECERIEREQKFWAKERAWIEARDVALMDTLKKLTGSCVEMNPVNINGDEGDPIWQECEITRLIQLRSEMETRFAQSGRQDDVVALWEEIGAKMASVGHARRGTSCENKWNGINYYMVRKAKECNNNNKRRKESTITFQSNIVESLCNQGGGYGGDGSSCSNPRSTNVDNSFRFMMNDGDFLWENNNNHGLKLSKEGENQNQN